MKIAAKCLTVGFLVVLISLILHGPERYSFMTRYYDLLGQAEAPLTFRDMPVEPYLAYRITTPLIAHYTGLRGPAILLIQFTANILTFALIYALLLGRMSSRPAFWTTLALALTAVASMSNVLPGYADSVTNLMVVTSMVTLNPLVLVVASVAGGLNDERFFLGAFAVVIWHVFHAGLPVWKTALKPVLSFAVALAIVLGVRAGLAYGLTGAPFTPGAYDAEASSTGVSAVSLAEFSNPLRIAEETLITFKWAWIILLVAAWRATRPYRVALLGGTIAIILAASLSGDISRSVVMAFPLILMAAVFLESRGSLRVGRLVIANVLTHNITINAGAISLGTPLPFMIWRYIQTGQTNLPFLP